jgi:protein Tex
MLPSIEARIADELSVRTAQVIATVNLLDEGATVPFIARYRKEVTDNLDDTQLRHLAERLVYLRELEDRRAAIISAIDEQGKLTAPLRHDIDHALSKQALEDLYLPYKLKRRTKAQIAREAGLEPLADALFNDPTRSPETEAAQYVNTATEPPEKHVADIKAALDGARQILMERFAEDAKLLDKLRNYLNDHALVVSSVADDKANSASPEVTKFRDWFDFHEPLKAVPSHRALAMFRGRNEDVLRLSLKTEYELPDAHGVANPSPCIALVANHVGIKDQGRPADKWLSDCARWAWLIKLSLHLESELMTALRERAEEEAIRVFARNLHDLLLAAPAGPKAVLGLDPGLRTGVKVAVVDATGKLLATDTIYPHEPRRDWESSLAALRQHCQRNAVKLIAIGNGTASRETDKLAAELMSRHPELGLTRIVVSEAGASVYSASELAAREFPELDVSLRGAVSIARRLQDPLAELVKIDPKSIGVGQYQHDLNQSKLARSLDAVVEDCVNAVGVDANTASAALLARISGLNTSLAANIVSYRDTHGAFASRADLLKVPRLGEKTFEQAAGFLRINDGDNPLDRSSVHPEAYPVVERILADIKKGIKDLIGDASTLKRISAQKYADERFGLPTVQDILKELEKPGRDPRPEFKTATFKDGIEDLKDLQLGMLLEGVITNVTNFGAFVDIGVHQDGLVHISALANTFVKDPHSVVKAGQVVKVKVLEVDIPRKRIALTMRLTDEPVRAGSGPQVGAGKTASGGREGGREGGRDSSRNSSGARFASTSTPEPGGTMAAAFAKLKR